MSTDLPLVPLATAPAAPAPVRAAAAPLHLPGTGREDVDAAGTRPQTAVGQDVLARAAQRVADSLGSGNSFSFTVDSQTGITVVKVINRSTGELVRQIPTEEVVRVAQLLQQDEQHKLLDVRA
jgi:flagellar protein FlaG